MRIIIVDDYAPIRAKIRLYIEQKTKHSVIAEAENGEEAVELCKSQNPDLVLTDIEMPKLDGINAAKKVLGFNSKIKIIAITMHKDKMHLEKLIKTGFVGCIFKDQIFENSLNAIETVAANDDYFPNNIKL